MDLVAQVHDKLYIYALGLVKIHNIVSIQLTFLALVSIGLMWLQKYHFMNAGKVKVDSQHLVGTTSLV